MSAISHHAALIYTMVMVSAVDNEMTDAELRTMGEAINFLPVFADYQSSLLTDTVASCADLLEDDDGLDSVFLLIKDALPGKLRETAYALACDVVAVDGEAHQEELRMLEMIRHELKIDRLSAAAIERGARARFATM
jgi:tellurite resistance protein